MPVSQLKRKSEEELSRVLFRTLVKTNLAFKGSVYHLTLYKWRLPDNMLIFVLIIQKVKKIDFNGLNLVSDKYNNTRKRSIR